MSELTLRDYSPSDLASLIELYRTTIRTSAKGYYSPEQIRAWAPDEIDVEAVRLRFADQTVRIVEAGKRTAGFATMTDDGHVDMLFVHPDFQGRGFARALLENLEALGYRMISPQEVALRGEVLVNFRMEKYLSKG